MSQSAAKLPAQNVSVPGGEMLSPDEICAMVRLHELG